MVGVGVVEEKVCEIILLMWAHVLHQNILSYLMVVAALVGSIASGFLNEFKSSSFTLITADVVNAAGCLLNAVEPVPSLQGFDLQGLGAIKGSGLSIMTIPLYIREGSAAQLRGGVIMFSGFVMTIGPTFHFLLKLLSREVRRCNLLSWYLKKV